MNEILVECSCGCSVLKIGKPFEDCDDVSISLYSLKFYEKQKSFFDMFLEKLKIIKCVLTNKEYCFYEVLLDKDDFIRVKREMEKITFN